MLELHGVFSLCNNILPQPRKPHTTNRCMHQAAHIKANTSIVVPYEEKSLLNLT